MSNVKQSEEKIFYFLAHLIKFVLSLGSLPLLPIFCYFCEPRCLMSRKLTAAQK